MSEERSIAKTARVKYADIHFLQNGMIQILFDEEYHLELEDIEEIRNSIGENRLEQSRVLLVVPGAQGTISREAREAPMFQGDLDAIAVITKHLHQRILGNLYFKFKKEQFSNYKLFRNRKEAEKWLYTQI